MSVCSRRAKVLLAQWNLQHRMSLQDGASQMSLAKGDGSDRDISGGKPMENRLIMVNNGE